MQKCFVNICRAQFSPRLTAVENIEVDK